jgi:hypothetical protein
MEPINYMLDIQSPLQQALTGYGLGRQDIEQRQVMQEREQLMDLRAAQEARAAAAAEEQRAAAAQARAKADAMQAQLVGLREQALNGTLTVDALNQFSLANAETFADFTTAFKQMEADKSRPQVQFAIETAIPALSGNPDRALAIIDERIAAAENAGELQEAQALRADRAILEADPQAYGVSSLSMLVATGAIDNAQADTILKLSGQGKAAPEGASPVGKIAQDVNAGLIPKSVLDAAIKLDAQTAEGALTLQQKIAEEARLRGEYAKRTEDLSAAERNFSIIETSSMDQSGAGDIALVTSFMKMLDPGSVVRETEFATAANAGGLLARLNGIAKKVETGQFLSPEQRADFKRLAGEYLNAAKVQEQGVQQSFNLIVDNYGLDPVNVFGARAATAPAPGGETGALPQSFLTNPNVTNAATAAGVTPEDMWNVMTPEQRARYGG